MTQAPVVLLFMTAMAGSPQDAAVVRAVLFFSPTCPHCHEVIQQRLPAVFATFGGPARVLVDSTTADGERFAFLVTNGTLEVLIVDASVAQGYELYQHSTAAFRIPNRRSGVPRLIVGDSVLVGSDEIPTIFPRLIERALAEGGLAWPAIPGLEAAVAAVLPPAETAPAPASDTAASREPPAPVAPRPPVRDPAATPAPVEPPVAADTTEPTDTGARSSVAETTLSAIPGSATAPTIGESFRRDPAGHGLAVAVLAFTIATMIAAPVVHRRRATGAAPGAWYAALAGIGLVVAGYLAYVEITGGAAVCGPVGDCATVHASPYARLFGVIPVGAMGVAGYVLLLAFWALARRPGPAAGASGRALLGLTYVAAAFSAYLTALEPFVIRAVCLWCLASAVIVTTLLWMASAAGPARPVAARPDVRMSATRGT